MNEYALEAVGIMFIGTRLGMLKGSDQGKQLMDAVKRSFDLFGYTIIIPHHLLKYLPVYKEIVELQMIIIKICKGYIMKAIEKDKVDGSLNGTILGKLIDRCGDESHIPIVMAVDSLAAGIDTTANSSTILFYHL